MLDVFYSETIYLHYHFSAHHCSIEDLALVSMKEQSPSKCTLTGINTRGNEMQEETSK